MESGRNTKKSAVLVIDLDNFKMINDSFGHIAGDKVLKACATYLTDIFKDEGFVGRIGGDEFAVFIKNYSKKEHLEQLINHFIDNFFVTIENEKQKISVSVGVSLGQGVATSFSTLYKNADSALYKAKQDGKGRFSILELEE